MSSKDAVLRLLLVEDQLEDAEQIISTLRNGGLAVRPTRAESEEQLQSVVNGQGLDMVSVGIGCKLVPFARVAEIVTSSGKDVPVIAVVPEFNDAVLVEAFKGGVTRMVPRERPEILQHIVRAEFAALESRRSVRGLENALRETERRCDALIESSRDPIAYIHEGMHIRANQAYLEMFGFEEFEDVEGLSVIDLVASSHADEFKQLLKQMGKGEAPPKNKQLVAQRSDGSTFDATMEFTQASYEGERCVQIVIRQKTMDAEVVRELDELRQRDQASGLFNRQYFLAELDTVVAAAADGKKDQAVLLVDIHSYAALLNDIGMAHADELLAVAARRLEGAIGESALAARFADHTFGVLLKDSPYDFTREVAENIRGSFQGEILQVADRTLTVTVSIGGVQIGEAIASTPQVLGKAGQSLQNTESLGGNRIEIFDPAARDRAEEERARERVRQVREAIENNGFVLYFQPIISLQGTEGECYEVLLRMQLPNGDLVPPLTFLPDVEAHGLNVRIDRWVIGRSIAILAERIKAGHDTRLFVNITTDSLLDQKLPRLIHEQLRKMGVPGDRLILEIPESKCFTNLNQAQAFQMELQRFGSSLSLEQFGSGLSSFQLLAHIDPDYVRIDRAYMADLAKNQENQKKVREIADKVQEMGKKSIAEFVQDAASMTVLFTSSVTFVCGNFLAPAGPQMNYDFSQ